VTIEDEKSPLESSSLAIDSDMTLCQHKIKKYAGYLKREE